MGFYDNLPGYKNPLGKDTPSWGGGTIDWKRGGGDINWEKPSFDVQKEKEQPSWYEGIKKGLFDTSFQRRQEREDATRFGSPTGGSAGQVLENLGVVFPQQHAPMFIPGVEGKKGIGGTLGTLAGIGASFIPGLGPGIAAAMPAIGGGIGSMFG